MKFLNGAVRLKFTNSPINIICFVCALIALPFSMSLSAMLMLFTSLMVWRTPMIREGNLFQDFNYIKQTLLTISEADGKKQYSLLYPSNRCIFIEKLPLWRYESSEIKEILELIAKLECDLQQTIFRFECSWKSDFFLDAYCQLSTDDKRDIVNLVCTLDKEVQEKVWDRHRLPKLFPGINESHEFCREWMYTSADDKRYMANLLLKLEQKEQKTVRDRPRLLKSFSGIDESDEFCRELMYTLAVCYQNKVIDYNPMLEFLKWCDLFAHRLDHIFKYDKPDEVIKHLWLGDQGKYIIDIFYVWKRRFGSAWLYDQVLDFVFKDSGLVDGVLISSGWYQKGITERIYSRGLNIALNLFDSDDLKFCYQKVFNWLKSYHNDKIWGSSTSENYFDKRRRDLSIWEKIFYSGRVDKQEMFCILGKLPDEVKHSILFSTTNSEGDDNFLLRLLRDYQADKAGQLEVVETLGLDIWEFEDVNGNTAFSTFIVQSETFGLEVLYRIDTLERQEKEALIQEMVRRRDGSNIAPTEGQALLVVDKLLLKSFTHKKIRTSTWAHVCNREANLRISGASGENSGLYTEMINRFGKFDSKTKISLLEDLLKLYTDNCPAIIKCLDDAYSLSTNFEIKKAIDILAKCFPGRTASFNPIIELLPVDRRQEISQMLPGLYYQNSWQRYSLFFDCQERSNTGNSLSSQRQVSIERMAETLWSRTDGFSRDMEPSWIKNHRAFDSNTSSFLAQFLSQEDRHALRAVSKNP